MGRTTKGLLLGPPVDLSDHWLQSGAVTFERSEGAAALHGWSDTKLGVPDSHWLQNCCVFLGLERVAHSEMKSATEATSLVPSRGHAEQAGVHLFSFHHLLVASYVCQTVLGKRHQAEMI